MSTVICPEVGHRMLTTGHVPTLPPVGMAPHVSSAELSAVVAEQVVAPEHTRITGSPVHVPNVEVQSVPVPTRLLQPTVYERPGVHV